MCVSSILYDGRVVAELRLVPGRLLGAGRTGVAADLHLVAAAGRRRWPSCRAAIWALNLTFMVSSSVKSLTSATVSRSICWLGRRSPRPRARSLIDRAAELERRSPRRVTIRLPCHERRLRAPGCCQRSAVGRARRSSKSLSDCQSLVGHEVAAEPRHSLVPRLVTMLRTTPPVAIEASRAAGRDLHLLERVEVVVGRRGAEGRHVGDHHAVDRPDGLIAARAGADVLRLLAALVAADVDAVGEHAGGGLQDRPRVAGGRDLLELGLVIVAPVEMRRSSSSGASAVTVITSSTAGVHGQLRSRWCDRC